MRKLTVVSALFVLGLAPLTFTPAPAAAATNYTLTAQGVWTSNDGLLNGTWQAHFDVAGYDLSGTLNILGLAEVGQGNIQGSWDLQDIGFGVMFLDQELATFDGGFDGEEFNGSFDTGITAGHWSGLLESLELTTQPITSITSGDIPTLILSRAGGRVGQIVDLAARLETLGNQITQLENLISFDSVTTPITALANGKPNCAVNPAINKADTFFEFLPAGCTGGGCNQVRAVVQSVSNVAAIIDGANLYTCKIKIAGKATTGIYQLVSNVVTAINAALQNINVGSLPGEISVKKLKFGDCSCSIPGESYPVPLASILLPLLVVVFRRFEQRSSRSRKS